jgi:hypothetical protein
MKIYTLEERRRVIALALKHPLPTPHTVLFEGRHQSIPVVELPLDVPQYNPLNHRIRSQLESHPLRDAVLADPAAPRSQQVLDEMLAAVEHFDELMQNLDQDGQREPGLCTPDGRLINANRRLAALRRLGRLTIRVAVLPAASPSAYDDLELDLQVRKDYREPYSFTNELLIVQELLGHRNLTEAEVARRLGFAASDSPAELRGGIAAVRASTRKLRLLRRLQQLSDGRLPLCHFDSSKTTIEELDRDHQQLLKETNDPDRAERLLMMRLVGMLVGVDYRWLREVGENFLERHLLPLLRDRPEWQPYVTLFEPAAVAAPAPGLDLPGLDLLTPDVPAADGVAGGPANPSAALDRLAGVQPGEEVELPGGGQRIPWSRLTADLGTAIERAAKDAKDDRKAAIRAEGPFRRLDQVEHLLGIVLARSDEFLTDPTFDRAAYASRVSRIVELARRLEDTLET